MINTPRRPIPRELLCGPGNSKWIFASACCRCGSLVGSRRETSRIAQRSPGKKAKGGSSALEGWIECTCHGSLNPPAEQGFRTAPPGRKSSDRTLTQGFTLGYFRLLPPGGTALLAPLFAPFRIAGMGRSFLRRSTRLPSGCDIEID